MIDGAMTGWVVLWPVLVLLGIALLIHVAFFLAQRRAMRPAPQLEAPPARRILDERYAHGEIDEDEYRRRRGELG